jgi:hypothetical protein
MIEGWKRDVDGILKINPKIYCESYLKIFAGGGKIWNYSQIFTQEELEAIKQRIIEKYIKQ